MIKKLAVVAASAVVVLLLAAIAAALFVDANQFRPTLESALSSALGRKVTVGHIKLALLRGGVTVDDVTIADDPAFSTRPFVTAKTLDVGVELMPLIFSRAIHVTSLRLDSPHVLLLRKASGTWNFSSVSDAQSSTRRTPSDSSPRTDMSISRLAIADGEVVIGYAGEKTRTYRSVTIDARDLSFTSRFPFQLSAVTPGGGALALHGEAGPISAGAIDQTPIRAQVEVKHFDVAASGIVDPRAGVAGVIEFAADLTSDGRKSTSKGTLRADRVQLIPGGSPARVPIRIDYQTDYDLVNEQGVVTRGDVHVGNALAHLRGSYNTHGQTPAVKMTLGGKAMPVQDLEAALPAIGVTLPAGASLQGGALDVDLAIAGPAERLVIAGPVHVSGTKLRSFDLGGRMAVIAALAGLPRTADTDIQTLAAALHIAPDGIQANEIQLVVPSIGTLTGHGTIAPSHALRFAMAAQPRNGALGGVSRLAALGNQENGIPFRIEGTTDNPVFVPELGTVAGNVVKSQAQKEASSLLKKLLHK